MNSIKESRFANPVSLNLGFLQGLQALHQGNIGVWTNDIPSELHDAAPS